MWRLGTTLGRAGGCLVLIAAVLAVSGPAQATFPGRNGPIAFSSNVTGTFEIWAIKPNGSGRRQLTHTFGDQPSFSANGRLIAFTGSVAGALHVFVMRTDGSHQVDLTRGEQPSFSRVRGEIVFKRPISKTAEGIFIMNANGSHQRELTEPRGGLTDGNPSFSPNGKQILFNRGSFVTGGWKIYVMNADGSHRHRIGPGFGPSFSPNGRSIIYASIPAEKMFVANANGSHPHPLNCGLPCSSGVFFPSYSPDGKQIVFESSPSSPDQIFVMSANGSHVRNLSHNSAEEQEPSWGVRRG